MLSGSSPPTMALPEFDQRAHLADELGAEARSFSMAAICCSTDLT